MSDLALLVTMLRDKARQSVRRRPGHPGNHIGRERQHVCSSAADVIEKLIAAPAGHVAISEVVFIFNEALGLTRDQKAYSWHEIQYALDQVRNVDKRDGRVQVDGARATLKAGDAAASTDDVRTVARLEDMSPDGRLLLHVQRDGDIVLSIIPAAESRDAWPSVEFCTSGGKSPRTLHALRALWLAMREDNADRSCDVRKPERSEW